MMMVVKRREMSERGAMAGRKRSWKNFCFRIAKKKERVRMAAARGMPA
jgi:hypothetical protein